MKYETPEVTFSKSAIDAVQSSTNKAEKSGDSEHNEGPPAYEDWEE